MKVCRYLVSLSLAIAMACLATTHASDAPPTGKWRGVLQGDAASRVSTQLTFQPERILLNFGEPANCRLEADFAEKDAKGYRYDLKVSPNGGRLCDRLYPGKVVVSEPGAKELKVSFPGSKSNWSGTFVPSGNP